MLKNQYTQPIDLVIEVQKKLVFLEVAISELWGSEDRWSDDIIFGGKLLMQDLHDDLEEVVEKLESDDLKKEIPSPDETLAKMGLEA